MTKPLCPKECKSYKEKGEAEMQKLVCCEKCFHREVCIFKSDFEKANSIIKSSNFPSFIKVNLSCESFTNKDSVAICKKMEVNDI